MVGARRFLVVFPVVFLISIFLGGIYIGKLFNFSYISMSFITFVFLLCIFILGMYAGRTWEAPFITRKNVWSIGIYVGDSPLNLTDCSEINNPVLTAKDVTDIQADFVADPFMIKKGDVWYMFMEVLNTKTQLGNIGLAVSKDGFKWNYKQIVIEEPFHMSYPYVLECDGEYYMIPETSETYSVRLYKADIFPTKWFWWGTFFTAEVIRILLFSGIMICGGCSHRTGMIFSGCIMPIILWGRGLNILKARL